MLEQLDYGSTMRTTPFCTISSHLRRLRRDLMGFPSPSLRSAEEAGGEEEWTRSCGRGGLRDPFSYRTYSGTAQLDPTMAPTEPSHRTEAVRYENGSLPAPSLPGLRNGGFCRLFQVAGGDLLVSVLDAGPGSLDLDTRSWEGFFMPEGDAPNPRSRFEF